jgi:hypothetical protein
VDDAPWSAGFDGAGDTGEEGADEIHPPARTTMMMITVRINDLQECITGQVLIG